MTSPHRVDTPANAITGTHTIYDSQGRVIRTEQLANLKINVTSSGIGKGESTLDNDLVNNPVTVLSYSTTSYDDLGTITGMPGRQLATTQFSTANATTGLSSSSTYNRKGQVTETRQEGWNGAGTSKVTFYSRTVYDDRDRVILQTDSYLPGETVFATRTLYDSADRAYGSVRVKGVVVTIDATGKTTIANAGVDLYETKSYYSLNRLTRSIDATGGVTEYEYDAFGRQIATIGPEVEVDGKPVRHRTESVFDDRGRTIEQRSGIIHDVTGNGNHDRTSQQRTRYVFDELNRVTRTIFNDGSFADVRYDVLGRKVAESKQVAVDTNLVWSDSDKSYKNATTGILVPTRLTEYDNDGRIAAVSLPAVSDPLNANPNSKTRPVYRYAYGDGGQQTKIIDPYGRETHIVFDALGRQIERRLPLAFGADGKPGTADDGSAVGFSESDEYDGRGRKSVHASFEGIYERYVYDDVTGRVTEIQYFQNASVYNSGTGAPTESRKFSFDDRGRVIGIEHFQGSTSKRIETTTYDAEGRVYTTNTPEGQIRYAYDVHGRMTVKEWSLVGNAYQNKTTYQYDALGRLKNVVQIDRGGVSLGQRDATSYTYNLQGNLDQTKYQNGIIHENDYDSLNRLDVLYHWKDLDNDGKRDDNEIRAKFDYTVRAEGRRTSLSEEIRSDTIASGSSSFEVVSKGTFSWEYDEVDRLISESFDDQMLTGMPGPLPGYDLDWVYDLVGNRLEQKHGKRMGMGGIQSTETTYQYDANDRLLTETATKTGFGPPSTTTTNYSFNKTQQAGKVVTELSVTTTQTTTYNLQGLLASVTTVKSNGSNPSKVVYLYDSTSTRIGSELYEATAQQPTTFSLKSRTEYLTDDQNPTGYSQVLQETEFTPLPPEEGPGVRASKRVIYVVGHDQISQTVQNWVPDVNNINGGSWSEATTQYFGTDGHGSVRVLFDAAASIAKDMSPVLPILQVYRFDAYGNLLSIGGQSLTPSALPLTSYLYSGESFDFSIDQQYLRARFYDAATGRFDRLDPYFGNSSDPQSFHKYGYVHGDPIQNVDPTGMFVGLPIPIDTDIGGMIQGAFTSLLSAYSIRLQWAVEWALDMNLRDELNPFADDAWIKEALVSGAFADTIAFLEGIDYTIDQVQALAKGLNLAAAAPRPLGGIGINGPRAGLRMKKSGTISWKIKSTEVHSISLGVKNGDQVGWVHRAPGLGKPIRFNGDKGIPADGRLAARARAVRERKGLRETRI